MAIEYKYSHRHGTSEQWAASTDILENHEIGIEYANDDIILVFGDGENTYANLTKINLSKIGTLEAQMEEVATQSDIPTKVSELLNDSGYALEEDFENVVRMVGDQTISGVKEFQDINTTALTVTEWFTAGTGDRRFSIDDTGLTEYKGSEVATQSDIPTKVSELVNDSGYATQSDITWTTGSLFYTIKKNGHPNVGTWFQLFEPDVKALSTEVTDVITGTQGIAEVVDGVESTTYEATGTTNIGYGRSNIKMTVTVLPKEGEETPSDAVAEFEYDETTGIVTWNVKHDDFSREMTIKFEYETIIYTYLRIE